MNNIQKFNAAPPSTQPRLKAVIIDDEPDICYLLSGILRQKNIQSVFAGTLSEAASVLHANPTPFYIFLDNHLPDGMGIEFISKLKKEHPSSIIIMLTAHDSAYEREKARSRGVDFFIGKPFSRNLILNAIGEFSG